MTGATPDRGAGEAHSPLTGRARPCTTPLSTADRSGVVRLLCALRPGLDESSAGAFVDEAQGTGYTVAVWESADGAVAALAGYRILPTSRGRVLFLEDLVVDTAHRRRGAARALLHWVTAVAAEAGCTRVELDTGLANTSAQALYDDAGLSRVAVHYGVTV